MRIAECFYELCEYGIIKRNGTSYVLLPFEMESEELSLSVTEHNEGRILDIKPHHRISHLCIYVPSHCKVRCSAGELKNGMLEFENIEEEPNGAYAGRLPFVKARPLGSKLRICRRYLYRS